MFEQTNLKYNGAALWLLKINDYNIFLINKRFKSTMCLLSREVPILEIKNATVTKKTALFSNNTSKQTKTSRKSINFFKYVTNL